MHKLAEMFYEDVIKKMAIIQRTAEDGAKYVKNMVKLKSKGCRVVADHVWEKEVVQKLRETGMMWVLLTTREASGVEVKPNETVPVDKPTEAKVEDVLHGVGDVWCSCMITAT